MTVMARQKLIVRTICPICSGYVEVVPDNILMKNPGYNDTEFVVTHNGYKQYYHSSCWYGMIKEQKKKLHEKDLA